jgi:hypothetical protein
MLNYTSQNQIEIFNFKTEFESKLNPENRWVKLAKLLDWDAFASIYGANFSSTMGTKGVDARIVIGALIIKHIERKDDRGTIEMIAENPYMQYFLGFDHFSSTPVFDTSLFVHIRKRLGNESFDKMNEIIITKALNINEKDNKKPSDSDNNSAENDDKNNQEVNQKVTNSGKLQLDATIADANIKFPTDLSLLNDAREKSEKIIDIFCAKLQIEKPRTYRIQARKQWLNLSKKKNKNYKEIRKGVGQQLNYLKRNLKHINNIIDNNTLILCVLDENMYKYLLVITELERQQRQMFKDKVKSISNRIVSIHQPHVRRMVRGKQGKNVEFGAKINVSLQEVYSRIDQVDFEAFNEGKYLIDQIERFKKLNKHYPELVQTDDIYMNRENRKYLKDNNIRHTGRPLGRRPKIELSKQEKKKAQIEKNERNHIEGKFGQAKSKYGLNNIKAKLENISKSWIAAIIFVINILKLSKDIFCQFLNEFICNLFYDFNKISNFQFEKYQ